MSLGALAMYGSYALLFLDFFVRRFLGKKGHKRAKVTEAEAPVGGEEARGQAYRRTGNGATQAVPLQ